MDLRKISRDINSQLNNYEIGKIQQFRVKAKKLSRGTVSEISLDSDVIERGI